MKGTIALTTPLLKPSPQKQWATHQAEAGELALAALDGFPKVNSILRSEGLKIRQGRDEPQTVGRNIAQGDMATS